MKNIRSTAEKETLLHRAGEIADRAGSFSWDEGGHLSFESRTRFQSEMLKLMREHRIIGATVAIVTKDATELFSLGKARLWPMVPVQPETCFRMASITKLIVTYGFLSMAEEGLLSLDDDISDLLGYSVRHPDYPEKAVTARMLLTHTSGITDSGAYASLDSKHPLPLNEFLNQKNCWLSSAPGETFHYSNLGAGITGILMEKTARLPLAEIMRQRVFDPLCIRATLDPRLVSPSSDLADGYRISRLPFLPPIRVYNAAQLTKSPPEPFDPDLDYYAGVGRLVADGRAAAALLRILLSEEDTPVLNQASLREMRSLQDGRGGIQCAGRGLNVAFLTDVFPKRTLVGHQGAAYGMCSEFFGDPKTGEGAVVLSSGMNLHKRRGPFVAGGFDLLALAFASLRS